VPRAAVNAAAKRTAARTNSFLEKLSAYGKVSTRALLEVIPVRGPRYLYDLVSHYPSRGGKGLRAALCFATCSALGGSFRDAVNSAVAVELFHNGFLVHDDIQDASELRRGAPTLHSQYGIPIALNVGNATNLLGLQRLFANVSTLGPHLTSSIITETERMMEHSLQGQALELGWIYDNECQLTTRDYLQMCLKKTSWYSFIYPMRVGALIAHSRVLHSRQYCRMGWYMGAAFQIQDDILNLEGEYRKYGKEICGDLLEGKRTLMLIHLLQHASQKERKRLQRFLASPRGMRHRSEIDWIYTCMMRRGSITFAKKAARQLAGAAIFECLRAFRDVPDSEYKRFIMEMILYLVSRDH